MDFLAKLELDAIGVPQKTLDDIERVIPNAERLLALKPEIEALYAKAKPDVDAIVPVLLDVLQFTQKFLQE